MSCVLSCAFLWSCVRLLDMMSHRHAIAAVSVSASGRARSPSRVSIRAPSKSWLEPPILQREFPHTHPYQILPRPTIHDFQIAGKKTWRHVHKFQAHLPWSSMGYYTITETISSSSVSAQNKIAAGVFLGVAGGLSRTDSSFANLDWLVASGPP